MAASEDIIGFLFKFAVFFIPFIFALSFHELAHGWVAARLGDNTATLMGRLTMNPFAHMDLVGTVVMPLFAILSGWPLFGWAKPVPVNPRNLKNPREDMFWVALAGPVSNLLLAAVGFVGFIIYFSFSFNTEHAYFQLLNAFVVINLLLAFFNLLPFHPLDGGKVIARFLSPSANQWLEANQGPLQIALIVLLLFGGFHYLYSWTIRPIAHGMMAVAATIATGF